MMPSLLTLLNYKLIMKQKGVLNTFIFALFLLVLHQGVAAQDNHRFPRKIWTFWQGEVNVFTKLCFNSMRHYASNSGWQFVVLDSRYFHYYLEGQTKKKFQDIKLKGDYHTSKLADLIRSFILYQQGGIWFDASIMLVQDMSWVQNIDKELIVYNKISKQPEVICYTYNGINGGNKTVIFDEVLQKEIMILPGTDNWGIIAKKKSKLFTDIIELYYIHVMERTQSQADIIKSYVDMGYQYRLQANPYFFFGNFHFQTVFQKKQKEIDRNPEKFNTKYAMQFYQIWLIRGQQTALGYQTYFQKLKLIKYLQQLFYSYSSQDAKYMKAIKFHGPSRRLANFFINISPYLVCSDIVPPLTTNSFIYKSAIVYEQNDYQILALKKLYQSPEQVCQQNSILGKIYVVTIFWSLFIICYLINYCLSCLFLKNEQKEYGNIGSSQ